MERVRVEIFVWMHHAGVSLLTSTSSRLHVLWHHLRQYLVVALRIFIVTGDVGGLVACSR